MTDFDELKTLHDNHILNRQERNFKCVRIMKHLSREKKAPRDEERGKRKKERNEENLSHSIAALKWNSIGK